MRELTGIVLNIAYTLIAFGLLSCVGLLVFRGVVWFAQWAFSP